MAMKRSSAGGGYGSKQHVTKHVRTGAPRERVRPSGVAQIGQRQGDHITDHGATGYGGINPFGAGKGYPSEPLGNEVAAKTVCGPGGSRTIHARGSQGVQGAPAQGNPMPKGELFPGWGKR